MRYSATRALKFFAYIVILFTVIYGAMLQFGFSDIPLDRFDEFILTQRGMMMVAAIVGLTILYPLIGVTTKRVRYISNEELIEAMADNGFKVAKESENKMVFTPLKFIDRLKYRFDDAIEVDNSDSEVTVLHSSRRVMVTIIYKLGREVL